MIFDEKIRTDNDPARQSESFYSYLDRSARAEADKIRNILEEWVSLYPTNDHPNFINKLRSTDDKVFLPAFFELYLYALMKKLNAERIDVEPSVVGITTKPDFYAHFPADKNIYIEARCLSEDEDYIRQDEIITSIIERIDNKLRGNNIGLSLQWDGDPINTDFSTKIIDDLIRWYKNLNQNDAQNMVEKLFEFDDWFIKFSAEVDMDGSNRIVHAVMPHAARMVTVDQRLRSALRKKGRKYGTLPEPFIIAVNILDGTYEHQVHNALFGNEAAEYDRQTMQYRETRIGNGFWRGEKKWHYTRVGAVVVANKLNPWTIFSSDE